MGSLLKDVAIFLLLAGLVTAACSLAAWWWAEPRRFRRALRRALGGRSGAELIGFGAAAALDGEGRRAAFVRAGSGVRVVDTASLAAVELIADGQVLGRACRDEARRPVDRVPDEAGELVLRFVLDDARDPDIHVHFWRLGARAPLAMAVEAARGWLARGDALMRQRVQPRVRAPADADPDEDWDEDA